MAYPYRGLPVLRPYFLRARLHALVLELGDELAQVLEQLLLQLPLRL